MPARRFPPPWSIAIIRLALAADAPRAFRRRCSSAILSERRLRYWRTQIAKAGPGLFEHDAVSVLPVLVIEISPCGHVIDAIVSPASQVKLQLDELGQLSCLMADKPDPGGP
jgi:hypothetical protein